VDHAGDLASRGVDGAMNHGVGAVDGVVQRAEVGLGEDVAVEVELDQARGRDLLVPHPVPVDEEGPELTGHVRRKVVGHHVAHAAQVHRPVAGRGVDTSRVPKSEGWKCTPWRRIQSRTCADSRITRRVADSVAAACRRHRCRAARRLSMTPRTAVPARPRPNVSRPRPSPDQH
jgi:hypothetical protein